MSDDPMMLGGLAQEVIDVEVSKKKLTKNHLLDL